MPMKVEDSAAITATGPGTPMGELFRSYWLPVMRSCDLPPGPTPRRIELLGERLVAFRTGPDSVGLVEEFCAHRGASLYYGCADAEGIRCPYHGWKYDPNGQCIDMPNEPATSRFKEHVRLAGYPTVDRGGVIWAYLSRTEVAPPGPPLMEWALAGDDRRELSIRRQATNFLQAMEGSLDTSHASVLHSDKYLFTGRRSGEIPLVAEDTRPRFSVETTEFGATIAGERTMKDGGHYVRVTQWVMPCFALVAPLRAGVYSGLAFVPKNDQECWVWLFDYRPEGPLSEEERRHIAGPGAPHHVEVLPGTYEPVLTGENAYGRQPLYQRLGSVTGIVGVSNQDTAVQESMGAVVDRTREHLASADIGIVAARRRLLTAARGLATGSISQSELPGRDPGSHQVRSASAFLAAGESWQEATENERRMRVGPVDATSGSQGV